MIDPIDSDIEFLSTIHLSANFSQSSWASLCKVIKASLLPEQPYGEDRPAEKSDFESFREKVVIRLRSVWNFVSQFVSLAPRRSFDRDFLVWTLILCGEHHSADYWTTDESCKLAALCVQALCTFHDCSSISQLLLGRSQDLSPSFKQALVILRPKLLQSTWRKHPGAIASYKWLLTQLCSPNLSEYLDIVSPTALIIIDDHDVNRRLLGLQCLSHIINNVARTELCQRGLHHVFYRTLEPLLWQRTASQIEPVVSCMVNLLCLTERGYTRSCEPGMWDLFDDTLSTLLDKMAFEDQIPLRLAYIKSLEHLISAMGHPVIRWSKPLLVVFDEYLHKDSFDTRKHALEAMRTYLSLSTPRLIENGDSIMYMLLRTCQDLSSEGSTRYEVEVLKDCARIIRLSVPDKFRDTIEDLKNLSCNGTLHEIFVTVFEL